MVHAIRQDVVVLPGGRIEIVSSELTPGTHAQVIVLEEAESTSGKPAGTRAKEPVAPAQRRAFMRLPLQERRRILAEQAERMAAHYRQDAEVQGLGGGDFLDS